MAVNKTESKKYRNGKTKQMLLSYISRYWWCLIISLLCAVVSVAFSLLIPVFTGNAVDAIVTKGNVDFEEVMNNVHSIAGSLVCAFWVQWIMNCMNNRLTYFVARDIRNDAFQKLKKLPFSYLDSHAAGDLVSRMIADVEQLSEGLLLGFTQLFTGVATIIGTLVIMLRVHAGIALVVILITPVSLFTAAYIAKKTFHLFMRQSEIRGEQTAFVNEMIGGQKVVRAYGYETEAQERFDEINDRLEASTRSATFFSSLVNPVTRFVNALVYMGVGLSGAYFAVQGAISVGQLSCFLSYANQYTKPFNEISGVITELQNAFACAGRVFELIGEEEESADGTKALQDAKGNLRFSHVDFSYQKEKELIKDLNLEVKPGWRVAIVGPTGCGKTTLINLLMRFYDVDQGGIYLEEENIRMYTRHSLRAAYGMVLQESWIRQGTVRENIAFGKTDATPEEIKQAAKAAYADNFINQLPDGYDTVIGEDGAGLSQGQKQLLMIARIFLLKPSMLILDEATSSVDTRTEMKIQSAFAKLMKGRTSFIVAHRLSTIREADLILVMKDGTIIEQGQHEELLAGKGAYFTLYNSQFS